MIETRAQYLIERKRLAESIARTAGERVTVSHYNIAARRLWPSVAPGLRDRMVVR